MKIEKTREQLEGIWDEDLYIEITKDRTDEHRWFYIELMIFEEDGKTFATPIMWPKSECQEGQDSFDDVQKCWEVEQKEVIVMNKVWVEVSDESNKNS